MEEGDKFCSASCAPVVLAIGLLFSMRLSFNSLLPVSPRWEGAPLPYLPRQMRGGEGKRCGEKHSLSDNKWAVRTPESGGGGSGEVQTLEEQQIQNIQQCCLYLTFVACSCCSLIHPATKL